VLRQRKTECDNEKVVGRIRRRECAGHVRDNGMQKGRIVEARTVRGWETECVYGGCDVARILVW
jgi:hypothetical protein